MIKRWRAPPRADKQREALAAFEAALHVAPALLRRHASLDGAKRWPRLNGADLLNACSTRVLPPRRGYMTLWRASHVFVR
jgi:hypothetical protein